MKITRQQMEDTIMHWLDSFWLETAIPTKDDWRAGIAIILAGKLKIEAALPDLLEMFEFDWDWWNESIEIAIKDMGTEDAVQIVIDALPELPEHGAGYACSAIEDMQIGAVASSIAHRRREPDSCLYRITAKAYLFEL
ncbi:MAG: hypothetical protein ACI9R3_003416 [Verrucomicrobiales bacterium]|jgi:hypothetical protein